MEVTASRIIGPENLSCFAMICCANVKNISAGCSIILLALSVLLLLYSGVKAISYIHLYFHVFSDKFTFKDGSTF